ncbi:MAG: nitrogenase cofactor biosynthesis protein NifB [Ignavibacteria bacterium]
MADLSNHPCFNAKARKQYGRIHLPVAPACNVQCNFCDRKYSCVNESRPGVTAFVMSPKESVNYLKQINAGRKDIAVVGIAGPGDPFANTKATLSTLEYVKNEFPDMLLCIATNGLELYDNVPRLAELEVSHVTVTLNATDPVIGAKIYDWVLYKGNLLRGITAAEVLLEQQVKGIKALIEHGIITKINSIIIPGINDEHIKEISEYVAGLGVDVQNCIPLLPVAGTPFETLEQLKPAEIHKIRQDAGRYISQMAHCTRCRADACGLLGEN